MDKCLSTIVENTGENPAEVSETPVDVESEVLPDDDSSSSDDSDDDDN